MSNWISVKDRLPEPNDEKVILFVLHTPAYNDKEFGWQAEKTKVVAGFFDVYPDPYPIYHHRSWSWWDEDYRSEACIWDEIDDEREEYGWVTYITHWRPLPEPPKGVMP